jgi:Trk K+ transport system NAD-binding subunit
VKFLTAQLMATLRQRQMRQNLTALSKYVVVVLVFVVVYTAMFHVLMVYEGKDHSWITGLYWTLTVMTTLGFGDITFESDLGRAFSVLVLITGVILLLIVLPFAFIRYFYAPWLEAQIRLSAPRELPDTTRNHVIICEWDALAEGLIARLRILGVPYVVLESDPARAVQLFSESVKVLAGEQDSSQTYVNARATGARLVVANLDDATNTNVILTVREPAPVVPIVAIAEDRNAVDILRLAGANQVVPLKHRLGAQLAARVSAGTPGAQVVGRFHDLRIAELPVHATELVGKTIRETRLRELTGLSVVGYWERGHLLPAHPEAVLADSTIAVVAGTADQIDALNSMFVVYETNDHPVIVIGGGKVGRATIRALKGRGVTVKVVEANAALQEMLEEIADEVVIGDAADLSVMKKAGIGSTPSVVLTTHDDAVNIYLSVYCRRLNPDCRIVSRIMHDRNLEAIHRAGADFVLGETALAVRSILAVMHGRELVIVGEEVDLFVVPVPASLEGKSLAESGIGAMSGLNVIGLQEGDAMVSSPTAATRLKRGIHLLALGTDDQRREFRRVFGA